MQKFRETNVQLLKGNFFKQFQSSKFLDNLFFYIIIIME